MITLRSRSSRKLSRFWLFYWVYILLLVALCGAGLSIFGAFLGAYERSLPEYAAESFIYSKTKEYWTAFVRRNLPDRSSEFNTSEDIYSSERLGELLSGEYEFHKYAREYTSERPVYLVTVDGVAMCRLTLSKGGTDERFGFSLWTVGEPELVESFYSVESYKVYITVPQGAVATLNGVTLTEEYIYGQAENPALTVFEKSPLYMVYSAGELYGAVRTLTVTLDGLPLTPVNTKPGRYVCGYPESAKKTLTVVAPEKAGVTVNGVALTAENSRSETAYSDGGVSFRRYTVAGLFGEPEVWAELDGIALEGSGDGFERAFSLAAAHLYDATVRALSTDAVSVNGVPLGEGHITETAPLPALEGLEKYVPDAPRLVTYRLEGLPSRPEVTSAAGAELVAEDGRSFEYVCGEVYSDALRKEHSELAKSAIKAYIAYTSGGYSNIDANYAAAAAYFLTGTDTYSRIKTSYDSIMWNTPYTAIQYNSLSADSFAAYSDVCFTCKVTFDVTLKRYAGNNAYSGTFTLAFVKSGEDWLAASLIYE